MPEVLEEEDNFETHFAHYYYYYYNCYISVFQITEQFLKTQMIMFSSMKECDIVQLKFLTQYEQLLL